MMLLVFKLEICRQGDVVLSAGERVGVAEVGILATVGAVQLPVYRQPLVAVLSTGELPH
jgi:molybdopterin biosynthesis enzyme